MENKDMYSNDIPFYSIKKEIRPDNKLYYGNMKDYVKHNQQIKDSLMSIKEINNLFQIERINELKRKGKLYVQNI